MKNLLLASCVGAGLVAVTGCVEADPKDAPAPSNCSILEAQDAQAWINGMPGPGYPKMNITFKAMMPTPGYSFAAEVTSIMEMDPPSYVVNVTATPPSGMVIQVLSEEEVRVDVPVQQTEAASVEITCGGATLFTVDQVETAY